MAWICVRRTSISSWTLDSCWFRRYIFPSWKQVYKLYKLVNNQNVTGLIWPRGSEKCPKLNQHCITCTSSQDIHTHLIIHLLISSTDRHEKYLVSTEFETTKQCWWPMILGCTARTSTSPSTAKSIESLRGKPSHITHSTVYCDNLDTLILIIA